MRDATRCFIYIKKPRWRLHWFLHLILSYLLKKVILYPLSHDHLRYFENTFRRRCRRIPRKTFFSCVQNVLKIPKKPILNLAQIWREVATPCQSVRQLYHNLQSLSIKVINRKSNFSASAKVINPKKPLNHTHRCRGVFLSGTSGAN